MPEAAAEGTVLVETDLAAAAAPPSSLEADACAAAVPSPPDTLRAKLWSALAEHGQPIKAKEMREACALYDAVRKDARRCNCEVVVDVCGGHGALGMLFVAHGAAKRTVIIDQLRPASHAGLVKAWRPFFGPGDDAIEYDMRPLQDALPEALVGRAGKCLVVACHACQHLANDIINCCLAANVDFAVCPCCPKDEEGNLQAAAKALGIDFGSAMVLSEMGRIANACDVRLRTFDAAVSPQNRVLFGRPRATPLAGASQKSKEAAGSRLRHAYERAQQAKSNQPTAAPQGGGGSSSSEARPSFVGTARAGSALATAIAGADGYEEQVRLKVEAMASLFQPLVADGRLEETLLRSPGMEIRRSPPKHFRARTVVPIGEGDAAGSEGPSLFRFVPDAGGRLQLVTSLAADTLVLPIAAALPAFAELLSEGRLREDLRPGLRCVKFHASIGGEPPQLLVCLVYGPEAEDVPQEEALAALREALTGRFAGAGAEVDVTVMASARGKQRCLPVGRDFVDERLCIGGRSVRYRQPFGQFSNPNPHIAVATAEWLQDIVKTSVYNGDRSGAASTDLLELYCGSGSHTVAMAPMFRHVLAVEINRHLVTAAEENVSQNGLENITVIRAPSEEFCKRVLRRRSYQLRRADGSVKLQLEFGCTIVDPPRAGLDKCTQEAVAGYDHVLYISCNPEALHRDLGLFLSTHQVCRLVLLDHFPFSAHVELGVYLRRRGECAAAAGHGVVSA